MMPKKQDTKDEKVSTLYKNGSRVRIQNEANQCWSVLLRCKDCQKVPSYFMRTPGHQFFYGLYHYTMSPAIRNSTYVQFVVEIKNNF